VTNNQITSDRTDALIMQIKRHQQISRYFLTLTNDRNDRIKISRWVSFHCTHYRMLILISRVIFDLRRGLVNSSHEVNLTLYTVCLIRAPHGFACVEYRLSLDIIVEVSPTFFQATAKFTLNGRLSWWARLFVSSFVREGTSNEETFWPFVIRKPL